MQPTLTPASSTTPQSLALDLSLATRQRAQGESRPLSSLAGPIPLPSSHDDEPTPLSQKDVSAASVQTSDQCDPIASTSSSTSAPSTSIPSAPSSKKACRKGFTCTTCQKYFSSTRNKSRHMNTHTGIKSHKCRICDKAFIQKSNLNTHQKIHSGSRPFKCPTCEKCFINKGQLQRHNRTHTGEKPYRCTLCNHSFSDQSSCKRHQKTHSAKT